MTSSSTSTETQRAPRNIVLCCDGTSNSMAKDLTNVAKLAYALVKDRDRQLLYYHPGLGTRAPGFPMPIGNFFARLAGLAFGYGLKEDLRDAYVFIMNHWRPGDRLYLFGFSRGAYTVRALAALIRLYGVAQPGNESLVPYAIRMLWGLRGDNPSKRKSRYQQADMFRATIAGEPCEPHFVGVWDTVSSVGWVGSPVALPYTRKNDAIRIFRHAIAIDERRAFFRTNRFQPAPGQDAVELWFPGNHGDVGGGYPEAIGGMSKYALAWMIGEAANAKLQFDPVRRAEILGETPGSRFIAASPDARLHRSMAVWWMPAEFAPKRHWNNVTGRVGMRFNLFRRRVMPKGAHVHPVAWDIPGYSDTLPPGITRAYLPTHTQ